MLKKILIGVLLFSSLSINAQIDLINDNIGIGTLNPTVPIQIKGDTYKFQNEAGVDLFNMNAAGNIGIGKNPTTHKLDVNGNISAQGRSLYLGNGNIYFDDNSAYYLSGRHSSLVQLIMRDKENQIYGRLYGSGNGSSFGLLDADGHWSFQAVKDSHTEFKINNDTKMHINNGAILVKPTIIELGWNQTGNQTTHIDLIGDATYSDFGLRLIRHGLGANSPSQLEHRGTGPMEIKNSESADMHLMTQSTHRVSVKGGGNVGIGTTNPSQRLHVNGSIQYTGSLINASDKRLKKNISDFDYGVKEVLKLNPVTYQYKDQISDLSGQVSIGLLAQELQKVAPQLVRSFKEPSREALDDQNEKSLEEFLAIEESAIKYMLINAIKEQQVQINEQRKMIEELQSSMSNNESIYDLENSIEIALQNSETTLSPYLAQNIPNPTHDETLIKYFIPNNTNSAIVRFYNLNGQILREVHLEEYGQGSIDLDLHQMTSGSYMYTLIVNGQIVDTKTMIITK